MAEPEIPDSPAHVEGLEYLIRAELVMRLTNGRPTTSLKGQAHVKQLCNLRLPEERPVWYGADGKIIEA